MDEEPGDQAVSSLAESALCGYELHVILFSFGCSKQMRPWILKNRSWKLLNLLLLPQVPWSNRPRQPRGSWWPKERWVNPAGQVVGRSRSDTYVERMWTHLAWPRKTVLCLPSLTCPSLPQLTENSCLFKSTKQNERFGFQVSHLLLVKESIPIRAWTRHLYSHCSLGYLKTQAVVFSWWVTM